MQQPNVGLQQRAVPHVGTRLSKITSLQLLAGVIEQSVPDILMFCETIEQLIQLIEESRTTYDIDTRRLGVIEMGKLKAEFTKKLGGADDRDHGGRNEVWNGQVEMEHSGCATHSCMLSERFCFIAQVNAQWTQHITTCIVRVLST